MKTSVCRLSFALAAALVLAASPASAQQAFPSADAAVQALVDVLGSEKLDQAKVAALLGANWRDFIPVGSVDRADVDAFLAQYREQHSFQTASADRAILAVGKNDWTLPVPVVKDAKGWHFDLKAGADEIRTRRIGRNELEATQSVLAYFDAQTEYAEQDHDDDGVLEYAPRVLSTDGRHDGLYWSEDDSGEISPLGPLFGDATKGSDWHGYHFRVLEGQGPSAPGGAYSYRLGDNMSRGFALIAWPAKYDDTGVMSFMISHEGEVFSKDLGPDTDRLARGMTLFDPDDSWTETPAAAPAP